jgi:hypothetical protein
MKKYTVISMVFALALIGLVQNAQIVRAEAEGVIPTAVGSNVSENTAASVGANANESGAIIPDQSGTGSNESGVIIPNTGNANANETGQIIPNLGASNANESGAIIPNIVGSNADESGTTPVPPVTPPAGPGSDGVVPGNTGGGSSGSSSSGSVANGSVLLSSTGSAATILPASCPLITDYLKLGGSNNQIQVTKLQAFLKNVEKLDVDVTGIFDVKTENAVKAFQTKYLASVLGPWNATRASGFVYITTTKKINEIACASAFTLSAAEQAIINEYKNRGVSTEPTAVIGQGQETTPAATSTLEVGTTGTNENVAAVGEASILSRFWSYIKNLFR